METIPRNDLIVILTQMFTEGNSSLVQLASDGFLKHGGCLRGFPKQTIADQSDYAAKGALHVRNMCTDSPSKIGEHVEL